MKEKGHIEVIRKAVELLNHLASQAEPGGVTEIAKVLDIPKSTAHRILHTLCQDNVVSRMDGGKYRTGPTVLLWGSGYRFSSGIVDLARPWLERLREESRETLHLSVYEGGTARYVDRLDSPQTVVLRWSRLGTRLPLYCTAAGRAILAALPSDQFEAYMAETELVPRTEKTERSPTALRALLTRCRERGYAEENQENEENIRCIGAALLNRKGHPVAAISLTAPTFRFNDEDAARFGAKLADAAREISSML